MLCVADDREEIIMTERSAAPPPAYCTLLRHKILLCAAGLVLNLALSAIAAALHLDMYLDTAGTILVSALGGFPLGAFTAFVTTLCISLADASRIYYGAIGMLVALLASLFASRGFYDRLSKTLASVPLMVLLVAVPGTVLTWFLNRSDFGGPFADAATHLHQQAGISPRFLALLTAGLLTELADKALSVLLVYLLLRILSPHLRHSLQTSGLWQKPVTPLLRSAINRQKSRVMPLKTRMILLLTVGLIALATSSTVISFRLYKESTVDEYTHMARMLSTLVANILETEPLEDYILHGRDAEGYNEVEGALYTLRDSYPDVEYLYVYRILEDGCHVVFDLDTQDVPGSEPGSVVPFDNAFAPYIPALLRGEPIDPIISDETFGWLLTVYQPVRDAENRTLCYVGVDYSMNMLSDFGDVFAARLCSILGMVFILLLAIGLALTESNVILPVNSIAYCALAFAYDSDEAREHNVQQLRELDIRTGDEVENLYRALLKTTEDNVRYIDHLIHARMQVEVMREKVTQMDQLATTDALTGLKNKTAYDQHVARLDAMIAQGDAKFGIAMIDLNFLKRVNDTYGHEQGNFYIQQCSKLVCTVFRHSPVFRIGGDEFVVVLEAEDYDNRDTLLVRFDHVLTALAGDDTLQPWERVSAAIGLAVFDPSCDNSTDSVFKRADQKMYANKLAMKAVRID